MVEITKRSEVIPMKGSKRFSQLAPYQDELSLIPDESMLGTGLQLEKAGKLTSPQIAKMCRRQAEIMTDFLVKRKEMGVQEKWPSHLLGIELLLMNVKTMMVSGSIKENCYR